MRKIVFGMVIVAAILAGCTQAPLDEVSFAPQDRSAARQASENVYYPLETMQQAAEAVLATRGGYVPQLLPTSRYIAFYPKNAWEFDKLINLENTALTTRSVYDEVTIPEGEDFISEQPAENGICNLYGIVKTGTLIPDGIAYEVLAEYYNPYEDPLEALDAEAATQVMAQLQPQTRAVGSRISGNISVVDDIAGKNAPVAHVQIVFSYTEAFGVVRSETVYTDGSGNYTTKTTFPTDLTGTYTINWKIIDPDFYDSSYYIGSSAGSMATTTFKIRSSTQNVLFNRLSSPEQHRYASAARGVRMAMVHGLDDNGYGRSSLSVVCKNTTQTSGKEAGQFVEQRAGIDEPSHLVIYCQNQPSQEIVAATCLALGDMSFALQRKTTDSHPIIKESYRVFARSYFLDKAYENIGALDKLHTAASGMPGYAPDKFNMQSWSASAGSTRTPLFIDIYDRFNQYNYYQSDWGGTLPQDAVSIYDFSQVMDIALCSPDLAYTKDFLKALSPQYDYNTAAVDRLMAAYERCVQ